MALYFKADNHKLIFKIKSMCYMAKKLFNFSRDRLKLDGETKLMRIDGLYKLLYRYYIYSVILCNPRLKPSYPFLGYTQELQILRFLMRFFAWKWKKIAEQKKREYTEISRHKLDTT